MSDKEPAENVPDMGAIMAELRADAKNLSWDLAQGIDAQKLLATGHLFLGIFATVMAFLLYFVYQLSGLAGSATLALNLPWALFLAFVSGLAAVEIYTGFKVRQEYSAMRRKYSGLISLWTKLGD